MTAPAADAIPHTAIKGRRRDHTPPHIPSSVRADRALPRSPLHVPFASPWPDPARVATPGCKGTWESSFLSHTQKPGRPLPRPTSSQPPVPLPPSTPPSQLCTRPLSTLPNLPLHHTAVTSSTSKPARDSQLLRETYQCLPVSPKTSGSGHLSSLTPPRPCNPQAARTPRSRVLGGRISGPQGKAASPYPPTTAMATRVHCH